MNFSINQWVLSITLDLLLKFGFVYLLSAFTLGGAPIKIFFYIAIALWVLNYIFLFLSHGFATLFNFPPGEKLGFTVVTANVLFSAAVVLLTIRVYESSIPVEGAVSIILAMVIINVLPILISVAICGLGKQKG